MKSLTVSLGLFVAAISGSAFADTASFSPAKQIQAKEECGKGKGCGKKEDKANAYVNEKDGGCCKGKGKGKCEE